jgi:hypothetical protein
MIKEFTLTVKNNFVNNTTTGTISGVPIATSDPVTYTVTAVLMARVHSNS